MGLIHLIMKRNMKKESYAYLYDVVRDVFVARSRDDDGLISNLYSRAKVHNDSWIMYGCP